MATAKRSNSSNGIRKITLKSGGVRYEARINAGHDPVSKTFRTKAEATEWRTKTLALIHTGTPVPKAKQGKLTVENAIDAYTAHRKTTKKKLSANQLTEFETVKNHLGNRPITSLSTQELEVWIAMIQEEPKGYYTNGTPMKPYAEASARRLYFALKKAVEWFAPKNGINLDATLFKLEDGSMPRAWAGQRERRLRDGEEQRLYEGGLTRKGCYTRQDWEAVIGFALESAMRTQEIIRAEFNDVDPDGELLKVFADNSKTQVGRFVPLSERAKAIIQLQKQAAPKGEKRIFHQFPSEDALGSAFSDLVARVKIEDLTFHDLRHEAISRLCVKHEMSLVQIMRMTGHKTMAAFMGYVQLYETYERKGLKAAQKKLAEIEQESSAAA